MNTLTLAQSRQLAAKHGAKIEPQARSVYWNLEFADPTMSKYILRGANLGLIVERLQYIETVVQS